MDTSPVNYLAPEVIIFLFPRSSNICIIGSPGGDIIIINDAVIRVLLMMVIVVVVVMTVVVLVVVFKVENLTLPLLPCRH